MYLSGKNSLVGENNKSNFDASSSNKDYVIDSSSIVPNNISFGEMDPMDAMALIDDFMRAREGAKEESDQL
jgi:hypothetical protein